MSSNRLSYDESAYSAHVKRSVDPLVYATEPSASRNCSTCAPIPGSIYPENTAPLTGAKVDIENTLSSRTWRRDRRQPGGVPQEEFQSLAIKYGSSDVLPPCPAGAQETRHSLLTNPKNTYRGLTTEHLVFTTLPIEPQAYVPLIRQPGLNSRQIAIDSYRRIMDANGACDRSGSNCAPPQMDVWPNPQG